MRIGGFNLVIALILGLFLGLGLRSFTRWAFNPRAGADTVWRRIVVGDVFLALGAFYGLFAWPMLIWDRPARALAAAAIVLPPLAAVPRGKKNRESGTRGPGARVASSSFVVVVVAAAILTLLRTGFITLKGDRVPLLLDVTGESRPETLPGASSGGAQHPEQVTAHRVVIWLPNGEPATDVWAYGSEVAIEGRALLFSSRLNALAVPNLYELLSIHNGAREAGGPGNLPYFTAPLPHAGSLAVHPWWRPIQSGILEAWENAFAEDSIWAIHFVHNHSPYYPLVGPDGQPLKRRFLLDLTLSGVPTSRGSSPLERR